MTTQAAKLVTAEELLQMSDLGRCELVRGEIIKMAPQAGAEHGDISGEIFGRIREFVKAGKLGKMFAAETGFIIERNPDTVCAPDIAFVTAVRAGSRSHEGFFEGAPDLAVEVVSPSDRKSSIAAKVDEWLSAGTQSVWVVDPPNQSIEVYHRDGRVLRYRKTDEIRDEPTLPGFTLRLAEIFPGA